MQTLDLDFEKAEKAKIVCGLDKTKCQGALLEIFSETVNELASHIGKALDFYYNNFPSPQKIEKIILCGGGANFLNINQVLKEKLNLEIIISDAWQNIANSDPSFFTPNKSQSFTTALGLALRGLNQETFL